MSDHVTNIIAPVPDILDAARRLGLPLQVGSAPRARPKPRGASEEERERIRRMTAIRERAQASGWPGPYKVQVPAPHPVDAAPYWLTWLDLPTAHDRLGTALARCRALVHGLPDGVKPGWYGDRLSTLGTQKTARVIDGQGHVVHEETREGTRSRNYCVNCCEYDGHHPSCAWQPKEQER